jgi:hypothetical protein
MGRARPIKKHIFPFFERIFLLFPLKQIICILFQSLLGTLLCVRALLHWNVHAEAKPTPDGGIVPSSSGLTEDN